MTSSYLNLGLLKANCKYIFLNFDIDLKMMNLKSFRSFDIGIYIAFVTMIVSTLYVTRSILEHIKTKRQSNNQVAQIPTISGSVQRGSQQVPQIQLNNNQFNPEVLTSRFLYIFIVLLFIVWSFLFFSVFASTYFPDDLMFHVVKRLLELGIIQAVCLTILISYPYVTNERLRRFIADEYFH